MHPENLDGRQYSVYPYIETAVYIKEGPQTEKTYMNASYIKTPF